MGHVPQLRDLEAVDRLVRVAHNLLEVALKNYSFSFFEL